MALTSLQRLARWPSRRRSARLRRAAADRAHRASAFNAGQSVVPVLRGLDQESGRHVRHGVRVLQSELGAGVRDSGGSRQQHRAGRSRRRPADLLPAATAAIRVRVACRPISARRSWSGRSPPTGAPRTGYGEPAAGAGNHRAGRDDQRQLRSGPRRSEQAALDHRRAAGVGGGRNTRDARRICR